MRHGVQVRHFRVVANRDTVQPMQRKAGCLRMRRGSAGPSSASVARRVKADRKSPAFTDRVVPTLRTCRYRESEGSAWGASRPRHERAGLATEASLTTEWITAGRPREIRPRRIPHHFLRRPWEISCAPTCGFADPGGQGPAPVSQARTAWLSATDRKCERRKRMESGVPMPDHPGSPRITSDSSRLISHLEAIERPDGADYQSPHRNRLMESKSAEFGPSVPIRVPIALWGLFSLFVHGKIRRRERPISGPLRTGCRQCSVCPDIRLAGSTAAHSPIARGTARSVIRRCGHSSRSTRPGSGVPGT